MKRKVGNKLLNEDRKFYSFRHEDGRMVETKAVSEEEAKAQIEKCLKIKLRRAA